MHDKKGLATFYITWRKETDYYVKHYLCNQSNILYNHLKENKKKHYRIFM